METAIKTIAINGPEGALGNIYFYEQEYYHDSSSGVHGPWISAEIALDEWAEFYHKDLRYFGLSEKFVGIRDDVLSEIREQKERTS